AASRTLCATAALEPLFGRKPRGTPPDGAGETAELVAQVAAHHEEVLAETVSSAAPASEEPETAADVEELDGMDFGDADPKRSKLEREVIEMQAEYERWEQRRKLAEQKGDRALVEQATREAD